MFCIKYSNINTNDYDMLPNFSSNQASVCVEAFCETMSRDVI